jgi:hypothetical protein
VIAKPVLFVRMERLFGKKDRLPPTNPIYKKVRSLFKKYVNFNPSRFEVTIPTSSPEEDVAEVIAELERRQSGTPAKVRAAS